MKSKKNIKKYEKIIKKKNNSKYKYKTKIIMNK